MRKKLKVLVLGMVLTVTFVLLMYGVVPKFQRRNFRSIYSKGAAEQFLLVDITETVLGGSKQTRSLEFSGKTNQKPHNILWYNIPNWIPLNKINQSMESCLFKNCYFTANASLIRDSSAVIFSITEVGIETTPPLQAFERPANQVWIFFAMESPVTLDGIHSRFHPIWKNSMNWSMNYRLDSDISIPYGYLKRRQTVPQRDYHDIFQHKTKFATWLVSNCDTPSSRGEFVNKLREYGLEIDVYGDCGMKLENDPLQMISSDYKFYLSFENTLCSDYITEKFFRYFKSDAIMVVRGGADYGKRLPKNTYIDTTDFGNFSHLVEYLKTLASNEEKYIEFLKIKDKYDSVSHDKIFESTSCALCAKLNNLEENKKIYETVPKYLETCFSPDDIEKMDIK